MRRWAGTRLSARASAAVCLALVASALALGSILLRESAGDPESAFMKTDAEELFHGLSGPNGYMPIKTLWILLDSPHGIPGGFGEAGLGSAVLLGVLGLGGLLGSPAGAAAAAAVVLLWRIELLLTFDLSTLVLLVVASAAVWRAVRPSRWSTGALVAALGLSLLYRSNLFMLGPVLGLWELFKTRDGRPQRLKRAAVIAFVPFLVLIPWLRMNWIQAQRLVPFEMGEADQAIVSGALGLVTGIERDWTLLVDHPPDADDPGAVKRWAVRQVVTHPRRYAAGVLRRWAYFIGLHPLVVFFAAVAFVRWRRQPGWAELALIALYFMGIHSLLAIHDFYLTPLHELLAVAAPFSLLPLPERDAGADEWARRVFLGAAAVNAAALAFAGLLAVDRVLEVAWTRPWDHRRQAIASALSAYPGDPYLLAVSARADMNRHRWPEASAKLEKALGASPNDLQIRRDLALALFFDGKPALLMREKQDEVRVDRPQWVRFRLLRGLQDLRRKRSALARKELLEAWRMWLSEFEAGEDAVTPEEEQARRRLFVGARRRFLGEAENELGALGVAPRELSQLDGALRSALEAERDG